MATYSTVIKKRNPTNDGWDSVLPVTTAENVLVDENSNVADVLNEKVDQVDGKGLSANDYTDADKNKLAGIEAGAEVNRAISDSVTSTSSSTNASSKAVKDSLDAAKAYATSIVGSAPETLDTLNELAAALGDDPNFATTIMNLIGTKVDKVTGKGLSENDFTDAYKNKVDGIQSGAQVNRAISDSTTSTSSSTNASSKAVKDSLDAAKAYATSIVGSAPETLDTLNELAAALGDDPNFATTITNLIGTKANIEHDHTIANVDGLQDSLNAKVETNAKLEQSSKLLTPINGFRFSSDLSNSEGLEIKSNAEVAAATHTFHIPNIHATNFGLDIDGYLKHGGASDCSNIYELVTAKCPLLGTAYKYLAADFGVGAGDNQVLSLLSSEEKDPFGVFDAASNQWIITVNRTGLYLLQGRVTVSGSPANMTAYIGYHGGSKIVKLGNASGWCANGSIICKLTAGSIISLYFDTYYAATVLGGFENTALQATCLSQNTW